MSSIAPSSEAERELLDAFFQTRIEADVRRGRWRGHFYQLTADLIMLEHRPDYARAFYDTIPAFRNRLRETGEEESDAVELTAASLQHLPMYVLYGWETGIYNEFRHLHFRGLTKAQLMELVMFAQLQAGMRGLQLVYNSVSRLLVDLPDNPEAAQFPAGWAPDPDAFKAGLDPSTRELTSQDSERITSWYERAIGYVPNSVRFAMQFHPEMYKWHRARWEIIFQKMPKQTAPYVMLRQHMLTGNQDALREAVLLGKAWGITKEWIVHGLMVTAFYTGFEGLHTAHAAAADILADWS
jgi:alkylhydroperoxidase/carboxymuconolactone decarboxylase family protein YurZ